MDKTGHEHESLSENNRQTDPDHAISKKPV